ncbi:MAG: hypothetical protein GY842_18100 [bacterium]|nr:hypothetical protein [bacterium]
MRLHGRPMRSVGLVIALIGLVLAPVVEAGAIRSGGERHRPGRGRSQNHIGRPAQRPSVRRIPTRCSGRRVQRISPSRRVSGQRRVRGPSRRSGGCRQPAPISSVTLGQPRPGHRNHDRHQGRSRGDRSVGQIGHGYSRVLGRGVHTRHHRYARSSGHGVYTRHTFRRSPAVVVAGPSVYVSRTHRPYMREAVGYAAVETVDLGRSQVVYRSAAERLSFREQADAVFRQGRYEEARRLYVRALLADEVDAVAQWGYALTHVALGEYGIAGEALRRVLSAVPELLEEPPDPRLMFGDGELFGRALSELRHQVTAMPDGHGARFALAYVEFAVGERVASLAHLDELIVQDDKDTMSHLLRDAVWRTHVAATSEE